MIDYLICNEVEYLQRKLKNRRHSDFVYVWGPAVWMMHDQTGSGVNYGLTKRSIFSILFKFTQ